MDPMGDDVFHGRSLQKTPGRIPGVSAAEGRFRLSHPGDRDRFRTGSGPIKSSEVPVEHRFEHLKIRFPKIQ